MTKDEVIAAIRDMGGTVTSLNKNDSPRAIAQVALITYWKETFGKAPDVKKLDALSDADVLDMLVGTRDTLRADASRRRVGDLRRVAEGWRADAAGTWSPPAVETNVYRSDADSASLSDLNRAANEAREEATRRTNNAYRNDAAKARAARAKQASEASARVWGTPVPRPDERGVFMGQSLPDDASDRFDYEAEANRTYAEMIERSQNKWRAK